MLLNLNELVAGFPFGQPITPVIGFVARFGIQLMKDKPFLATDPIKVREVMTSLLEKYSSLKPVQLRMLGLRRLGGSTTVVVSLNDLPLCATDCEHGCCMQYLIVERSPGGTKGLSKLQNLYSLTVIRVEVTVVEPKRQGWRC